MKEGWNESVKLEMRMAHILGGMERHGFLVDKELMLKHIADLTSKIEAIDSAVLPQLPLRSAPYVRQKVSGTGCYAYTKAPYTATGKPSKVLKDWYGEEYSKVGGPFTRVVQEEFDLGSGNQVKEYLLRQGWRPEKWNYSKATGKISSPVLSGEDPFLGVSGDVGQQVAHRMKCRHRRSQLEGWLSFIRDDGRISQIITGMCPTARLKHKQIVNIPGGEFDQDGNWVGAFFGHEMRSVFIAPEGYKIVGCDAASCQIRMLCHYMEDAAYTEAVLNGKKELNTDIHSVNMQLTGLPSRAKAKTFIYAFLFGAGDSKLATILGISPGQVRKVRSNFMHGLPALDRLVKGISRAWSRRGYLVGLDGRKLFVRSQHMLLVYLLQAAEAVMMKAATCYIYNWIEKHKIDAHLVAHVHDEFQWECREDQAEHLAHLCELAIEKAYKHYNLNVPGEGEAAIGNSWADTH